MLRALTQALCRLCKQAMNLYMLTQTFLLLPLLLCCVSDTVRCSAAPDTNTSAETDALALLEFKRAVSDPGGALSSWNASTRLCQWKGVTCADDPNKNNGAAGRVTELRLADRGLSGAIAGSVGNLTALRVLDLSNNRFSGRIPAVDSIRGLQVLDLSTNSLEGSVPDALTNCSSLTRLWLYSNALTGSIPRNIGYLSNLVNFDLSGNNLTGTIPPSIGNASRLDVLYLGGNQLTGSIPDGVGELSAMSVLELNNNLLSGSIPSTLFNLSSLQTLDLGSNMLGDTLPSDMGDRLVSLQSLILNVNQLEGQIPSSIGRASELQSILISANSFSGPIPASLGNLSKLSTLNLEENALETRGDDQSWGFLTALGNCALLNSLSLDNNNLQGELPDSIGNLSPGLQVLRMGFNNMSGTIPPGIGKLRNLTTLGLSHNRFTGVLGGWLGNLEKLQYVDLESNGFTGPIPPSAGNLTQLLALKLANNGFQGSVPASFGNLQQLADLDLSYNNLRGSVPDHALTSPRMRTCVLSYNSLEGSIPLDFSRLQELTELYLSSNAFTGDIPDSIGQCQMLQTVEMDRNLLTGNVPVSFGNLKSLSTLNLSHNNLSGPIPSAALTGLQYLTRLDISYNDFTGEVPRDGVFANATAVSLQGNRGLCGGATTLHMPSCRTRSNKRAETQYYLIEVLIPVFGFMSLALLIYFLLIEKTTRRRRRQHLPFPSFGKQFPKVTYQDLAQATKDFSESNLVGRGSYGSVYRCRLKEHGMEEEMAVKVFDLEMPGAERSFLAECEALRSIQHRNLLPIRTACSAVDNRGGMFKALLYEFMPNGSLDTWLHPRAAPPAGGGKAPKRLGFSQRVNVIVNVADVLDYLHHECGRPTVHCDLKPSNILLDDDLNALLGDFGIARFYADSKSAPPPAVDDPTSSVGVRGTIGYIAPGMFL
jgi:Leucine-rich repeat (LRR) protein